MTLNFIRKVDDSIGMILCRIVGWFLRGKRFFFRGKGNVSRGKVKTILCQKYFGMGSILCALPLIKALRRHYPNAKIIFLSLDSNAEVIRLTRAADKVLTIRVDSVGGFISDLLRVLTYFWRNRVDMSIDLEFFAKFTMLISFFSRAKTRVGLYQSKIRPEGIITHNVYYNHYRHLSEIYFAFADTLGIERRDEYFNSLLPHTDETQKKGLKKQLGLDGEKPIVIINVNSSGLFKFRQWPGEHFAELIKKMIQKYPDYQYVMIGAGPERTYVASICEKVGVNNNCLMNCAGETDISRIFQLISMAYLMITNDSGPMHIAAFYEVNVAAFFGPETPLVYGPVNNNKLTFYSKDVYCSPCMNVYDSKKCILGETCPDNVCLKNISPEEAFEKIEKHFLMTDQMIKSV